MMEIIEKPTPENRSELKEHRFGSVVVCTWKRTDNNWNIYPWLFSVQKDGEAEKKFTGVPNYCETRHIALMRGWHRARWLNNGTYGDHYKPIELPGILLPGIYKVINE